MQDNDHYSVIPPSIARERFGMKENDSYDRVKAAPKEMNENDTYDRVTDVPSERFDIRENDSYGRVKAAPKKNREARDESINFVKEARNGCYKSIAIAVIVVAVVALILAVAASCVAFALEISNLKADIASVQQQNSAFEQLLQDHLEFDERIQQLNISLQKLVSSQIEGVCDSPR